MTSSSGRRLNRTGFLIDSETIGRNLINEEQLGNPLFVLFHKFKHQQNIHLSWALRCLSTLLVSFSTRDMNNHILSRGFNSLRSMNHKKTLFSSSICLLVSFHPRLLLVVSVEGIIGRRNIASSFY